MTDQSIAIGADVGGSHISCAAIDMAAGQLLPGTQMRASVDNNADSATILGQWARALNDTIAQVGPGRIAGIGFAMPGPFDYVNGISKMQHKFVGLYDVNIPEALRGQLSVPLPMRFLNDATSFAVGEAWLGQGRGHDRVVAITLGTGFGSAFIDQGAPVVVREDVPDQGCLWHLPFGNGIADEFFSTRWFVGEYEKLAGKKLPHVKAIADASPHDAIAAGLFVQFGKNLATFIGPWLKRFGADILVMGGNITGAYALFGPAYEQGLAEQGLHLPAKPSSLGEDAAMIGCARLFEEGFWDKVEGELRRML
ncbi:MAG: ROK family protein [Phaeodactylibacter sp.]|nr:ROK family protein [Phaeodactylibacter sp.]MCB9301798.1 ROK family protein [Lewinellaceae bacterium]